MHNDKVAGDKWQQPDVRLTERVVHQPGSGDSVPSAIPVFIGWRAIASLPELKDAKADWIPIAAWDQRPPDFDQTAEMCLRDTVRHYFDNGGGPCVVLLGAAPPGLFPEARGLIAWWETFVPSVIGQILQEPRVTLVAVPQLVTFSQKVMTSESSQKVMTSEEAESHAETVIGLWEVLLTACNGRSDLFFVLDAPAEPATATACIRLLRGKHGLGEAASRVALYGPHLVTDYRVSEKDRVGMYKAGFRVVPPCGAVLGAYVRTDVTEGVWCAPANAPLLHVVQPDMRETQAYGWFDTDQASINLIRSFAGRGTRIWGCRTLSQGTAFRYVQVRRAVTWIEANLQQICRFAVFEPNNEITWFQIQGLCHAWLRRVWLDGGLAGADEASAFSVQVGLNESMTRDDIDAGRLKIRVGVSVLHAAEFIDVTLELTVGDAHGQGN